MAKEYKVILGGKLIGVTKLEKGDAAMGVVFGELILDNIQSGYTFFKTYCAENDIEFEDHPDDKLILTRDIPQLVVINSSGLEIKGLATSISGMDSDVFEIMIEGLPYPFYEEELPHHVRAYNEQLGSNEETSLIKSLKLRFYKFLRAFLA